MCRRQAAESPSAPDRIRTSRVYHRAGAPWLADFEAELLAFPAGTHDDRVDTIAYAAKALPGFIPVRRRRRHQPRGVNLLEMEF